MPITEVLFWLATLTVGYIYVGFPLIVMLRARLRPKRICFADFTPIVSLLITAHNEASVIRKKLDNVLSLDYPKDRLEVIVASDGSDDGTNEIVSDYSNRGVVLLALPRRGKIPTLNEAVPRARGQILIFSDANSMYAPGALRALVRPFADPRVGGVAGDQRYLKESVASSATGGERAYWSIDRMLKQWQSRAGSVTSATGAIYAIRQKFFRPLPSGVCDDAMISYRVMAQGARMVFEPEAIAFERVAPDAPAEFRRKVRVCTRGLRTLMEAPDLFNPFRFGFYSLQLFSHKLLRWLAIWPLSIAFLASLRLWPANGFYELVAVAQSIFYGLAFCTFFSRRKEFISNPWLRVLTIPFYFCLANSAFLAAQIQAVRGQRIESWEVRRAERQSAAEQSARSPLVQH
jgi:cellulose synthase/poly-beta-1,6-N-acetylglucosamine synthase-like glycosyltransferase